MDARYARYCWSSIVETCLRQAVIAQVMVDQPPKHNTKSIEEATISEGL